MPFAKKTLLESYHGYFDVPNVTSAAKYWPQREQWFKRRINISRQILNKDTLYVNKLSKSKWTELFVLQLNDKQLKRVLNYLFPQLRSPWNTNPSEILHIACCSHCFLMHSERVLWTAHFNFQLKFLLQFIVVYKVCMKLHAFSMLTRKKMWIQFSFQNYKFWKKLKRINCTFSSKE